MAYVLASGTVSSDGIQATTEANQEFDFSSKHLNNIIIQAGTSDITVKFNSESVEHPISAGEGLNLSNLRVIKFTIVENGVQYKYTGTHL